MSPKFKDDRQQAFDFDVEWASYIECGQRFLEQAQCQPPEPPESDGIDSVAELYLTIGARCIEAMKRMGLSRQEILDLINERLGRSDDGDSERPISIHMFNNYLSPSKENRIRVDILWALCQVTGDNSPIEPLLSAGHTIVSQGELMELMLGKLDRQQAELGRMKSQIRRIVTGGKRS